MPSKIKTAADLHSILIETGMLNPTQGIHVNVAKDKVTIQHSILDEPVDKTILESKLEPGYWVQHSAPGESVFRFQWHPGEPAARTAYIMAVDSEQWDTVLLIDTECGVQHIHRAA